MKVAFISLGCAKNLVNTEQMMALCREAGYTVTGEPEGADVAVVNTCGFIDSAKSEAIDTILSIAPLKEQGRLGKLLVAGCLTQRYQDEILEELPEVDGILGTGSYTDIVPAIEAVLEGDTPTYFGDIDHTIEDGNRLVSTPAYTAYLKIAEGCDNRCAYCVIPYLRGRYRSRPMESLLEEARLRAGSGSSWSSPRTSPAMVPTSMGSADWPSCCENCAGWTSIGSGSTTFIRMRSIRNSSTSSPKSPRSSNIWISPSSTSAIKSSGP